MMHEIRGNAVETPVPRNTSSDTGMDCEQVEFCDARGAAHITYETATIPTPTKARRAS